MTEVYKLLFDVSFYYSLSGYFCYLFTQEQPFIWGLPLIIASAVVSVLLKKMGIGSSFSETRSGAASGGNAGRFTGSSTSISASLNVASIICCALPAFILMFDLRLWQFLQFLPAWGYCCFAVISGRISVSYSEFEDHFSFTGKLYALLFLGILGFHRIPGALTAAIPYITVYLLTGVCLMRILREDGKLSTVRNIVVLLVMLFGAAALAWLDAPHLLYTAIGFIYRNVIIWVITGLVIIAGAIGYGFYLLIAGLISLFGGEAAPAEIDLGAVAQEILGEEIEFIPNNGLAWLRPILLALAAIVIILILFFIFRRLLGNRSVIKNDSAYSEEKESLAARKRSRTGGILKPKDPRLAIRWYYKKYLKEGVARGAALTRVDTSKNVMDKYRYFFDEVASEELRNAYIISRYSDEGVVTKQDADTVNELWRKLSRKPNV